MRASEVAPGFSPACAGWPERRSKPVL